MSFIFKDGNSESSYAFDYNWNVQYIVIHLVHILFAKIGTPVPWGLLLLLWGRLIVISYPCTPFLAICYIICRDLPLSLSIPCFPTGNISNFPFLFGANFVFTHCSLFSWHLSCLISIDSGVPPECSQRPLNQSCYLSCWFCSQNQFCFQKIQLFSSGNA